MQDFFSQTTDAIALKVHKLGGHHQRPCSSTSDFDTIMPLFGLKDFG